MVKCVDCSFWEKLPYAKNAGRGVCRALPPQVIHGEGTRWPETCGYDSCGQGKADEDVKPSDAFAVTIGAQDMGTLLRNFGVPEGMPFIGVEFDPHDGPKGAVCFRFERKR